MSKKRIITSTITVNNKKYTYSLKRIDKKTTRVLCKAANIDQPFHNEDLAELLFYLPDYIVEEENERKREGKEFIRFRVSGIEKKRIQKNAFKRGYTNVSSFLRALALDNS